MPKNLLQDMVKIKRAGSDKKTLKPEDRSEVPNERSLPARKRIFFQNVGEGITSALDKGRGKHALWIVAIISIIFLLYSISFLFFRATVAVNTKTQDVVLNENLSALNNSGETGLSFDLIAISGEEEKRVEATGEEDLLKKAKGIVVIYNTFSSSTQRLDIDTRLEGSNGKIYKTEKQIVVPGMKGGTPGSIEVGIYAAEAGEAYNSVPLDFTIFGFRGTPKYSKFYARSKGEIAGGFKGKVPAVSDADKAFAINDLKTILQAKLFKKAADQIPNGFVLFKDAAVFRVDESSMNAVPSEKNLVSIKIRATLNGFLFNEDELTKKIAERSIEGYDDSPIYSPDVRNLTFYLSDKNNLSFEDVKNINFNLSGPIKIVWKLDESKLIADLLGKSKRDFKQILSQYPNIDSAELEINPFWKTSFPDNTKDIKVVVRQFDTNP